MNASILDRDTLKAGFAYEATLRIAGCPYGMLDPLAVARQYVPLAITCLVTDLTLVQVAYWTVMSVSMRS